MTTAGRLKLEGESFDVAFVGNVVLYVLTGDADHERDVLGKRTRTAEVIQVGPETTFFQGNLKN
jgi:hypothetical protein